MGQPKADWLYMYIYTKRSLDSLCVRNRLDRSFCFDARLAISIHRSVSGREWAHFYRNVAYFYEVYVELEVFMVWARVAARAYLRASLGLARFKRA